MLGVVFELFIVKENLLAGGKNEFRAAIDALHDSIREFHGHVPEDGEPLEADVGGEARRSRFPVFFRKITTRARGRLRRGGENKNN
jgi:hypothetical protein